MTIEQIFRGENMKAIFLALGMMSANLYAYDIDLISEKINIGKIEEGESKIVIVKRTALTPEEVSLTVSFDKDYKYCAEERARRVYIPGDGVPECNDDGMGRPRCRGGRHGGYWETQTYCVRYENARKLELAHLLLDFDSALDLTLGEEEFFKLTLNQKAPNSGEFYFKGEVVKSSFPYQVKEKKNKLKFKVQD